MASSDAVDTTTVAGRRKLRFESLDALRAEVEAMAAWKNGARALGNWSPGQNLAHLAAVMRYSIDGFPKRLPWIASSMVRLFFKRRILYRPMRPGFKAPRDGGIVPAADVTFEDGIAQMRAALQRLKVEPRRAATAFMGRLTAVEWERLHCRHAELHLSFVVPAE